jgi:signal peptidase I
VRPIRLLSNVALTTAAVVGAACLLVVLAGLVFGVRPVIFRSGSMAPTAPMGSLGVARLVPADSLGVGDVVTVPYNGTRVTHRIVAITHGSSTATLRLKGDANRSPDPAAYQVSSAARLWFAVPRLGTVVAWLSRPPGIYVLVLYLALMLVLAVRPRPERPDRGRRRRDLPSRHRGRRARPGRRALRTGATVVATMAVVAGPGGPAVATTWSDGVAVSGTNLAAATVPPSASFGCLAVNVLSVTFGWSAVPGATSYTIHFGSGGSVVDETTSTTYTTLSLISNGTAWVVANHNYGSTTWSSVASNTRTYTVAVVGFCG